MGGFPARCGKHSIGGASSIRSCIVHTRITAIATKQKTMSGGNFDALTLQFVLYALTKTQQGIKTRETCTKGSKHFITYYCQRNAICGASRHRQV